VDARSKSGRTPLHEASHAGHTQVCAVLLKHHADINALSGQQGQTPLILACENGKLDVAELLVTQGADCSARDSRGKTAFDLLLAQGRQDTVQRLDGILRRRDFEKEVAMTWTHWKGQHGVVYESPSASPERLPAVDHVRLAGLGERSFKVMSDTFFLVDSNHEEAALYRALAFASIKTMATSERDVQEALNAYELKPAAKKSPLFLLAHARLAQRRGARVLQVALLREFRKVGGALCNAWMTQEEGKLLQSVPEHTEARDVQKPPTELEREYARLVGSLTPQQRAPIEELMQMVGLEEVKRVALSLYADQLADKRLSDGGFSKSVAPKALNFMFMGNPGTGKTVTAKLFGKLLEQSGARAAYKFIAMTAGEALRKGAKQFAAELASLTGGRKGVGPPPQAILRKGMAVEVISPQNQKFPGKVAAVDSQKNTYTVDYADGTAEEDVPRARVVAVGEAKNVGGVLFLDEAYDLDPKNNAEGRAIVNEIMSVAEEFRDTVTIILAGYKDELESKLIAFNAGMASRFKNVHFADFSEDQLADIWRKNCRDMEFQCAEDVTKVASRRVARGLGRKGFGNARDVRKLFESAISFAKMHFDGGKPTILMEDVIGKEPSAENIPELRSALHDLNRLTGLASVKRSVAQLIETAKANYRKELGGEAVDLITLNRLFLGNPGTGKTTVAAIYGRILKALRYLSNGEVMLKVASDFVGDKVGEAQTKTRAILEMAEGKVLLIDEAYALDDNLYGKQALDTIVEKVQATAGADVAVIMAGYKAPMLKMLREQNPGLTSRFDPKFAIHFDDYEDEELLEILGRAVAQGKTEMPIAVKSHAVRQLAKQRALANFGNARAVQTLLANARARLQARLAQEGGTKDFTTADVDPDLDEQDPKRALEELKAYGRVADELAELGLMVNQLRKEGGSLKGLVNHFVFTGAPGTGKTTVARLIARVLFAYGIIATKETVETSAPNLIGAYVGHTRKGVDEKMQQARGGVLFIDEAYEMGKGAFGHEAVAQLLNNLTLPEYMDGNTVVILAGYEKEMHTMLELNPGLKSRFTSYVHFEDLSPAKCAAIVAKRLGESQPVAFTLSDAPACMTRLESAFAELQDPLRPGWANGRDAMEMAKKVARRRAARVAKVGGVSHVVLEEDVAMACKEFFDSRPLRDPTKVEPRNDPPFDANVSVAELISRAVHFERGVRQQQQQQQQEQSSHVSLLTPEEEQLEEEACNAELDAKKKELEDLLAKQADEAHRQALRKELQRLEELRRAIERANAEEKRKLLERERKREEIRRKLASMGQCPAGYSWHREGPGFRCGGGSHYVTLAALGVSEADCAGLF
jgi:AAA+ superfamily predicted ATPase